MCLPAVTGGDLTVQSMNWTALVYGAPMTMIMVWWVLGARTWFKGPRVNVQHMSMAGLVEIEGVEGGVVGGDGGGGEGGAKGDVKA